MDSLDPSKETTERGDALRQVGLNKMVALLVGPDGLPRRDLGGPMLKGERVASLARSTSPERGSWPDSLHLFHESESGMPDPSHRSVPALSVGVATSCPDALSGTKTHHRPNVRQSPRRADRSPGHGQTVCEGGMMIAILPQREGGGASIFFQGRKNSDQ